jgi:hypothetical protein
MTRAHFGQRRWALGAKFARSPQPLLGFLIGLSGVMYITGALPAGQHAATPLAEDRSIPGAYGPNN